MLTRDLIGEVAARQRPVDDPLLDMLADRRRARAYLTDGGGTARVEAAPKLVASVGGSVESFYFALGADDAYIVCDLPDHVTAVAAAMAAAATGMVVNRMVVLLTAEEVDRAAAARLSYNAPGS